MHKKTIRLLLIEDDELFTRLIRSSIHEGNETSPDLEYVVESTKSLSSGLEILADSEIDVVLLDLVLPDSDAPDTFFSLHSQYPHIPIVILSSYKDEETALNLVKEGAQDYLLKGKVGGEVILKSIRYAIERKKIENELIKATEEQERKVQVKTAVYKDIISEMEARIEQLETEQALQENIENVFSLAVEGGVFDLISDPVFIHDYQGTLLVVNSEACDRLKYTCDELIQLRVTDIDSLDDAAAMKQRMKESREAGYVIFETVHVDKNGSEIPVQVHAKAITYKGSPAVMSVIRDISIKKKSEERQTLTLHILDILNKSERKLSQVKRILELIKKFSGFEAVGIRLPDEEDFPYFENSGFPKDFIESENYLCSKDEDGNILRDTDGASVLECMCGNVISGATDAQLPFFTEGGSFWTNSTSELLKSSILENRYSNIRNRFHDEGYETVVLIPLRSFDSIIGILQLNDRRADMITDDDVRFFEDIGRSIGIAFEHERVNQEREELVRELQEAMQKVKTLSGLLPICAHCKKIRVDEDYWEQIESFIEEHSHAEFTHSICPTCIRELYTELTQKQLNGEDL